MYKDVVTVFNRKKTRDGDVWYPKILTGVNLNIDRSAVVKAYGEQSQDNVILNVKLNDGCVGSLPYLQPKAWQREEDPKASITFKFGEDADFFWAGEWTGSDTVPEDGYGITGFRDYMSRTYDNVFEITSVSEFSVIPHLQITGK